MSKGKLPAFGPRLRELRNEAGLTLADLAEKSGLHSQTIVKLEGGERGPVWGTVVALADALGVPVEAFRKAARAEMERRPGRPRKEGLDEGAVEHRRKRMKEGKDT